MDETKQVLQRIAQIADIAQEIRLDWTDPRAECRQIIQLCAEIQNLLSGQGERRIS